MREFLHELIFGNLADEKVLSLQSSVGYSTLTKYVTVITGFYGWLDDMRQTEMLWKKKSVQANCSFLYGQIYSREYRYLIDGYAARLANVDSFVGNLPLGYNTKIGMEGVGVSQGQKQRILIARLIYKSPEILLLDEATNSLDSKNEKSIMSNLQACFKNKTVVMAAHRLSTIRNADQIIVMKDGRVEEVGTHSELLARRGEYYALIENQL